LLIWPPVGWGNGKFVWAWACMESGIWFLSIFKTVWWTDSHPFLPHNCFTTITPYFKEQSLPCFLPMKK
jgi:hypothetical protein